MKWYSIKKYIPQKETELLIRAKCLDGHERYFIAILVFLEDFEKLTSWEVQGSYDLRLNEYTVTHFCVLDPVEIEE